MTSRPNEAIDLMLHNLTLYNMTKIMRHSVNISCACTVKVTRAGGQSKTCWLQGLSP